MLIDANSAEWEANTQRGKRSKNHFMSYYQRKTCTHFFLNYLIYNVWEIYMIKGYGMTESSPGLLLAPLQDWVNGSAGLVMPNTLGRV